jgi:hypothetical protein
MPGSVMRAGLLRAAVAGGLLFTLTACGGSDSPGPAAPQPPARVAPQITAQPQHTAVDAGALVTLSVSATGTAPLAYQWKRNGAAIPGATSSSYTFTATAADHNAEFTVVVANEAGTVESQAARLEVRTAPAIVAQPQSQSVLSGVPAAFSVAATGSGLMYQWHRNGQPIPGATNGSYSVGVPLAGDDGAVYSVVITNSLGAVTSANATLSVNWGAGIRATSYANAKGMNAPSADVPGQPYEPARAFGDFFGAGSRDFFVATQVYDWDRPESEARPGEFQFWRATGSAFVRDSSRVIEAAGCIHPRKALVADFNRDSRPDVFVICHGYDRPPFPGEPNYVLLSQPDGRYTARTVGPAGFYHGGTAMDVNHDGNIDVVLSDNLSANAVFVLLNDGHGNFTRRNDLIPIGRANYFTVEAADVNGDGRIDLLAGGHDWENAETVVLLNDGSGSFANTPPIVLPRVPNEGVVLDFAVFDADFNGVNEIYVLRTSGGDGTFYQSVTVQQVLWPTLTSTVLLSERRTGWATWVPFMNPVLTGDRYTLMSDVASTPLQLPIQPDPF